MERNKILRLAIAHVKSTMDDESTGHDWWHVSRVWKNSLRIARREKGADLFIVQLGALFHDIADWKFHGGDENAGAKVTREWLERAGADEDTIARVCDIVTNVSFKGASVRNGMKSLEGKIVQDADRLDAMGAIGIARTFAYGGSTGRPLHDPNRKPHSHVSFEAYRNAKSSSINHFHEKLLLLKARMNTKEGGKMAEERDAFMREYLRHFMREWKGS
ncbi:HD domain protein [uncultured archaeon]|nr:HD domain protein [uncultured archaeon]